jgi:3-oxoacyl-[acyl-carrier protein] reductase
MKVAIITGATSGIGLATSRVLKREGWSLSLVGRKTEAIEEEFKEDLIIKADISDLQVAEEIVKRTVEKFGRLDALINNAGQTLDKPLLRITSEDLENHFRTNLFSAFLLSKSALRYFKDGGVIVNVSSVVGIIGNSWQTAYSASKAGLIAFTKSLAKEMGSRGIRVVAVAPGFIETPMTEGLPELLANRIFRIKGGSHSLHKVLGEGDGIKGNKGGCGCSRFHRDPHDGRTT